ncbi:unnamed protein product [Zymoseptoria tritici ST99CH_1A5]|uniref:Uncharacterized protein n=1 Tax=Zymoseptoria tritici ST99CH_1A5 TaxID=1276529 RepID=A0A1Y6M1P8_ZYMTR|nr:unnamed protein product [Zymoseptoria tritici ST99CH_1A5]
MSTTEQALVTSSSDLINLPPVLHHGLSAIAVLGTLSLITSSCLFCALAVQLLTSRRKLNARVVQFLILIFNLFCADIQQSIAFALNAVWVFEDAVLVGTRTCVAQGWFLSIGDMASGVFTSAIAIHCFMDIILGYRMRHRWFSLCVAGLWMFVYALALGGVLSHLDKSDMYYTRAGAWCFINKKYIEDRIWLHYFWLVAFEFCTALVYTTIVVILRQRIRSERCFLSRAERRAAEIAVRSMVWYPLVHGLCTLPLVIIRLRAMAGQQNSFAGLCVAGALITSCGWLDVLLFLMTRRAVPNMALAGENVGVLATFATRPWYYRKPGPFGTTTTISVVGAMKDEDLEEIHGRGDSEERISSGGSNEEHIKSRLTLETRHTYGECGEVRMTTVKTVDIRSEAMNGEQEAVMLSREEATRTTERSPTRQEELMFAQLTEQLDSIEKIGTDSSAQK